MKNPIYDEIGIGYDITRKADPEITHRLYHHLQAFDDRKVIDVACGSGNYTIALSDLGVNISGTDISQQMIKTAKGKSNKIQWHKADVTNLPFKDYEYSGATCILAIHHFQDLYKSFLEIYRILNEGSRFVIFTSSPEQMKRYWLNEYFPNMMEKSAAQMPDIYTVTKALKNSGFHILGYETFLIQPNLQDFFLYSGKYRPEIYLNVEARKGISSFAILASQEEVEDGINKLESDIKNGLFKKKALEYVSELGDYLFIIAKKPELSV